MASKLGVTALYVTPTQESGGSFDPPGPRRIAATELDEVSSIKPPVLRQPALASPSTEELRDFVG